MAEKETEAPVHVAGEAGSGTIPGDRIGTAGVTGGTGAFGVEGGVPPRSRSLGTAGTGAPPAGREGGGPSGAAPQGEGAMGDTLREHTVVPEAKWGVTAGAPSGGVAGGTPAQQVADALGEDEE